MFFFKSKIRIGTLEGVGSDVIYRTFASAFSDYPIPLRLSYPRFLSMLVANAFSPGFSAGAYCGRRLVGVVINGLRRYEGVPTAYDSGTGVLAGMRNRGIASRMFELTLDRLRRAGVRRYLLEVLCSNGPALHVYRKYGFTPSREFACFKSGQRPFIPFSARVPTEEIPPAQALADPGCRRFFDVAPAWQNSAEQILLSTDCTAVRVRADGRPCGYGILNTRTGALHLLAVAPENRRRGIGSSIMAALWARSRVESVSVLNVDTRCTEMLSFFRNAGFADTPGQYEMTLRL